MLRAISAELQKWRRTWFVVVTIAATLATPVLLWLAFLVGERTPTWGSLFSQGMLFELMLFGPLVVTLIGAQSISTEYQYDTWKLSLTSPVARWKIYAAKWIVGFVWIVALSVIVLAANIGVGLILGATGELNLWLWTKFFVLAGAGMAIMLPVYHLVTLISRSFFFTSGVGIVTTFTGVFVVNSKYAALFPQSSIPVMLSTMTGEKLHPEMVGSWPVWIGLQVGLLVLATLGSALFVQKADYR